MPPSEAIRLLVRAGATVATCESLTGGLICSALTSVAGSSQVVRGGLITYNAEMKSRLAGVDPQLIASAGVVSDLVAWAMATGVRRVCGADWGIAVTGVAGPGAHEGVPAGTVYLGVAGPGNRGTTRLLAVPGDRAQVRATVVDEALGLLIEMLTSDAPGEVP